MTALLFLLFAAPLSAAEPAAADLAVEPEPPALMDPADVAVEADRVNRAACLDVAEQRAVSAAGVAMAEVSQVWVQVDAVFEAAAVPRPTYLRYWRGVLGQCLDRNELALGDLQAFVAAEASNAAYADLVRDAEKRIVRVERSLAGVVERPPPPLLMIGLGGGFQRLEAPSVGGWDYGLVSVDASFRLKGPLALTAYLRLGVSDLQLDSQGGLLLDADGRPQRSVLPVFGLGPLLRFGGPVYGFVGALLQLAPSPEDALGAEFLVGGAVSGGVEIPFGDAPLGLRVSGEVGNLNASISVRAVAGLFVRIGE